MLETNRFLSGKCRASSSTEYPSEAASLDLKNDSICKRPGLTFGLLRFAVAFARRPGCDGVLVLVIEMENVLKRIEVGRIKMDFIARHIHCWHAGMTPAAGARSRQLKLALHALDATFCRCRLAIFFRVAGQHGFDQLLR